MQFWLVGTFAHGGISYCFHTGHSQMWVSPCERKHSSPQARCRDDRTTLFRDRGNNVECLKTKSDACLLEELRVLVPNS